MGKSEVILRARQFFRSVGITSAPVDIDLLAAAVNAKITISTDLDDDESGYTFPFNNKHTIVINGKHREERRRFTALHEIAHIVLGIPSQHHGQGQASNTPDQRDR